MRTLVVPTPVGVGSDVFIPAAAATELRNSNKRTTVNIIKSFGVYTVAGILGKIASFLLLPFFTHYLTESDYGIINIFSNSVYFIAPFMTLGIGETFSVEYRRFTKDEEKKFISTSLFLPFTVFALSALLILVTGNFFEAKTGLSRHLLFMVALLSVFNFFSEYILIIFRNQHKAIHYAGFNLTRTIVELTLAVAFIKYLHLGANGRINSILSASLLGFVFVVAYLLHNRLIGFSLSKQWLLVIVRRGLPAIPLFFMIFVLGSADKYIINYYYGKETVGLYGLAWQFGMVLLTFIGAFMTPFYPFLYQHLESKEYGKIIKMAAAFMLGLSVCIAVLLAALPSLFHWLIAPSFHRSLMFIPYMLFGQLFWALSLMLFGYIYYKRRNYVFYYLSPVVILSTIAIDYLLLVKYPVSNFALVSFLSYLFCFLIEVLILRKDLGKLLPVIQYSLPFATQKNHKHSNR